MQKKLFSLTEAQARHVEALAKEKGISESDLIRRLLDEHAPAPPVERTTIIEAAGAGFGVEIEVAEDGVGWLFVGKHPTRDGWVRIVATDGLAADEGRYTQAGTAFEGPLDPTVQSLYQHFGWSLGPQRVLEAITAYRYLYGPPLPEDQGWDGPGIRAALDLCLPKFTPGNPVLAHQFQFMVDVLRDILRDQAHTSSKESKVDLEVLDLSIRLDDLNYQVTRLKGGMP